MIVLDENIPADQCEMLWQKHIHAKHIGFDAARKGIQDYEIIPFLHQLNRPTFFTLDVDYFKRRLRHDGYCLVYMDIEDDDAAAYILQILRHPALDTKAKRMGAVIRAEPKGISLWRIRHEGKEYLSWE
jgi:hypothetical protein